MSATSYLTLSVHRNTLGGVWCPQPASINVRLYRLGRERAQVYDQLDDNSVSLTLALASLLLATSAMRIVKLEAAEHECLTGSFCARVSSLELDVAPGSTQYSPEAALSAGSGAHPASWSGLVSSNTFVAGKNSPVSLLDLPCEIRLQVYHLVHISSPVKQPQLAPWYPIPTCKTHIVQAVTLSQQDDDADDYGAASQYRDLGASTHAHTTKLLPPHRPFCRIPTALLQTCRQVCAEARAIPFHANEFVFINWFSSGLASALAFARARRAWQREALRWVRLEVFARDVAGRGAAKFEDWCRLCGEFWGHGLRGLRLTVWMKGGRAYQAWETGTGRTGSESEMGSGEGWKLVEERRGWITQGLGKMVGLRQLEVELADVNWTGGEKVAWCGRLLEVLRASNGGREVNVVCVEKKPDRVYLASERPVPVAEAVASPLIFSED